MTYLPHGREVKKSNLTFLVYDRSPKKSILQFYSTKVNASKKDVFTHGNLLKKKICEGMV